MANGCVTVLLWTALCVIGVVFWAECLYRLGAMR
jgi:hypothetical protein